MPTIKPTLAKMTTLQLPPERRSGRAWSYCLLGEDLFYEFCNKGVTMEEIVQFARVRPKAGERGGLFE